MTIHIKNGSSWVDIQNTWYKRGGSWEEISKVWYKTGGSWVSTWIGRVYSWDIGGWSECTDENGKNWEIVGYPNIRWVEDGGVTRRLQIQIYPISECVEPSQIDYDLGDFTRDRTVICRDDQGGVADDSKCSQPPPNSIDPCSTTINCISQTDLTYDPDGDPSWNHEPVHWMSIAYDGSAHYNWHYYIENEINQSGSWTRDRFLLMDLAHVNFLIDVEPYWFHMESYDIHSDFLNIDGPCQPQTDINIRMRFYWGVPVSGNIYKVGRYTPEWNCTTPR